MEKLFGRVFGHLAEHVEIATGKKGLFSGGQYHTRKPLFCLEFVSGFAKQGKKRVTHRVDGPIHVHSDGDDTVSIFFVIKSSHDSDVLIFGLNALDDG